MTPLPDNKQDVNQLEKPVKLTELFTSS